VSDAREQAMGPFRPMPGTEGGRPIKEAVRGARERAAKRTKDAV
jgi:hypothetical protein